MSWTNTEYVEARICGPRGEMAAFARKFIPADTLLGVYHADNVYVVPIKSDGHLDLEKFSLEFNDIAQICRFGNNIICFGDSDHESWTGVDYMNHSCEPNCVVKSQLVFWSLVDIEADSELLFDYRTIDIIPQGIECWCDTDKKCII